MAKKKNGKNKGKITRERNKVLASLKAHSEIERNKRLNKQIRLDELEAMQQDY